MVSGPVRKKRYSRPIDTLPRSVLAHSFSVRTFFTLKAMRSCRWSWRFSPTPGDLVDHRDAVLPEQRARADAGELEDLRRADRTGGEHGLDARAGEHLFAALRELDAGDAPSFEPQPAAPGSS